MLLERDAQLATLTAYADEAGRRDGRVVLLSGEAGVGKTALLERFEQEHPDLVWAWGGCDSLFTPRPLGPLEDIADRLGGELAGAFRRDAPREERFRLLLRALDRPGQVTACVIEDVHWADEATLDMLVFLARRIRDVPALLLVSYRDDGLAPSDSLRVALGELSGHRATRRLTLPPLSVDAVRAMVDGSALEPAALHKVTGGNPFYVTEVLRADAGGVPGSARDAVLARAAGLAGPARELLDVAALIGTRVDPGLLADVADDTGRALDECLISGLLTNDGATLRFRHEIARRAVEEAVPTGQRVRFHALLLAALRTRGVTDAARLAYHAEGAGDGAAVREYAPLAALRAAELGSHREAVAEYERALRFTPESDLASRARLNDVLATELDLVDRWEAIEFRGAALSLWRELGDTVREAESLRLLGELQSCLGRGADAATSKADALALLEPLEPTPELARALITQADELLKGADVAPVRELARRALDLAELFGDAESESGALATLAWCAWVEGERWEGDLQRALTIAVASNLQERAGELHSTFVEIASTDRRFVDAERLFAEAIAYCEDHDLALWSHWLTGLRTQRLMLMGRWDEAVAVARPIVEDPSIPGKNALMAVITLGLVLARRDDAAQGPLLERAVREVDLTLSPGWVVPGRLALVEAAWLDGRLADAREAITPIGEYAAAADAWERGAVETWRVRLGLPPHGLVDVASPYRRSLDGDWRGAWKEWSDLGCPYDAVMALADSDEEADLRQALEEVQHLEAPATERVLRAKLRAMGATSVPAGPRPSTRANAAGLTGREQDVLALLVDGLTNAEIARRLVLSVKTVDHHVSAVLGKLGVSSRKDVAAAAARLGLVEAVGGSR